MKSCSKRFGNWNETTPEFSSCSTKISASFDSLAWKLSLALIKFCLAKLVFSLTTRVIRSRLVQASCSSSLD